MSYQKKQKGEFKTVSWYAPKRKTIKFEGDEDSLQIADNVMEKVDFEKFPIVKGDIVEVSIKDEEVIFFKKISGASKEEKVETKNEAKSESKEEAEIKTIIVEVVRKDKTALKETNGTWPKISENLQGNEAFQRGATIEVKMLGETIVAVKKQGKVEGKKEQKIVNDSPVKQEPKKIIVSKDSTAISIESQQALKEAVAIVRTKIETGSLGEEEIIRLIKVYTKACYEAMQEV